METNYFRKKSARPSRISIPPKANPLVKLVFGEMARQSVTYDEIEWRAGVLKTTLKAWRFENSPGLLSIEAALGALGWCLVPVPKFETLSCEQRAALGAAAELFATDEQAFGAAIIAAADFPAYAADGIARQRQALAEKPFAGHRRADPRDSKNAIVR